MLRRIVAALKGEREYINNLVGYQENRVAWLEGFARQRGSVARIGPRTLLVTSPSLSEIILARANDFIAVPSADIVVSNRNRKDLLDTRQGSAALTLWMTKRRYALRGLGPSFETVMGDVALRAIADAWQSWPRSSPIE